jgi:hypothetical protein
MPVKDLNRNRKVYPFIRRKPDKVLVVEDKNASIGKGYDLLESFTFVSGDVGDASGSGFVSFTTSHVLDEKILAMPHISITGMSTIEGAFPYIRESTRAIASDKLIIDVFFKSQLVNPTNTYKVSQSDLQTKIASDTISITIKLSYIV